MLLDGLVKVIDDFHDDPVKIREIALSQKYDAPPQFDGKPGGGLAFRANCSEELSKAFLDKIQSQLTVQEFGTTTIQFRYTLNGTKRKAVCHADGFHYAGICYLTLPDLCEGWTAFFRHKLSGDIIKNLENESQYDYRDPLQWEQIEQVEMNFNRLVFYPGDLFHAISAPFFGDNIDNARLTQNMFINLAEK